MHFIYIHDDHHYIHEFVSTLVSNLFMKHIDASILDATCKILWSLGCMQEIITNTLQLQCKSTAPLIYLISSDRDSHYCGDPLTGIASASPFLFGQIYILVHWIVCNINRRAAMHMTVVKSPLCHMVCVTMTNNHHPPPQQPCKGFCICELCECILYTFRHHRERTAAPLTSGSGDCVQPLPATTSRNAADISQFTLLGSQF